MAGVVLLGILWTLERRLDPDVVLKGRRSVRFFWEEYQPG